MVLVEKDIIKEVNKKYLALIMNRLWRINSYVVTISMDNTNSMNIIVLLFSAIPNL